MTRTWEKLAAAGALAALTFAAGCGGGGGDTNGCRVLQDKLKTTYDLADRWQYGNAPNSQMLDQLVELKDSAGGQAAIAKTNEFKAMATSVQDAASGMYRAVNSGVGTSVASDALLGVGGEFLSVCGPLLKS